MYSYEGLLAQLDKTGHKKTDLTTELGLSSRTVAKIAKGEKLSARVMAKVDSADEWIRPDIFRPNEPSFSLTISSSAAEKERRLSSWRAKMLSL